MFDQWKELQDRYDQLMGLVVSTDLDNKKRQKLQKELSQISEVLKVRKLVLDIASQIESNKELIKKESDQQMIELYKEEIEELQHDLTTQEKNLDYLLFPPDEHDNRSIFLEIRAGAGGKEAALFVSDLLKMYSNYALKKGWKTSIESSSGTELGGFREVVLHIKGKDVFGHFKYESGVHRVQRVPATEGAGRVHTSTATVAVLPEAKEVDIQINSSDLRIDVFRASGAGGQHVNTTDSAVRITHIPTGVVVSCQDERSQHKNKAKAMKQLQSRILLDQIEKEAAKQSKLRKSMVGSGGRSEKVRTYNYPQNRVTDHQIGLTLKKLDVIVNGEMDEIIDALREENRKDLRNQSLLEKFKAD